MITQLIIINSAAAISNNKINSLSLDTIYFPTSNKLSTKLAMTNSSQYQSFTLNIESSFDSITWRFYAQPSISGKYCNESDFYKSVDVTSPSGSFTLNLGTYTTLDKALFNICSEVGFSCEDEFNNVSSVKVIYNYSNKAVSYGQCYDNMGNADKLSNANSNIACTEESCSFSGSYSPDLLNSWVNVGVGFSAGAAYYQSLAIDQTGTLYVAYSDIANGQKSTVMKFNGTSWTNVGSAGFSAGIATPQRLAIDLATGTPYVAYQDKANSNKTTVMKFNGTSWADVGSVGFSVGSVAYSSLAIDQKTGTPYVAYQDKANGNKTTVMKFNN